MIKLVIASMDDSADWRVNSESYRVGHTVINAHNLNQALPQCYLVTRRHDIDNRFVEQLMLLEFDANQALRETGCVNWREIEHRQNVGQPTDMVFMSMSN